MWHYLGKWPKMHFFGENELLSFSCTLLISFLESVGCLNTLQKAVLHDLKEFIAGTKTLALVSKFITCPSWCV